MHAQNFSTCRLLHRGSQQTSNHVCQLKLAWNDPWTGQSWSKFIDCPDSCAADLYIPLHSPYFNFDADSDSSVLAFIKQRHCLSTTIIFGSFKLRFIHLKVVETLVTCKILCFFLRRWHDTKLAKPINVEIRQRNRESECPWISLKVSAFSYAFGHQLASHFYVCHIFSQTDTSSV